VTDFKVGDRVKLVRGSSDYYNISKVGESVGIIVREGSGWSGPVVEVDGKETNWKNGDFELVSKTLKDAVAGDILTKKDYSFDRKVLASFEHKGEHYLVTADTDDDSFNTEDIDSYEGWTFKGDVVEVTLEEIAEKMGINVSNLRIKE